MEDTERECHKVFEGMKDAYFTILRGFCLNHKDFKWKAGFFYGFYFENNAYGKREEKWD